MFYSDVKIQISKLLNVVYFIQMPKSIFNLKVANLNKNYLSQKSIILPKIITWHN